MIHSLQCKMPKGNTNTTLVHFIINGDKDKKELNPTITYHIITLAFVKNNHFSWNSSRYFHF